MYPNPLSATFVRNFLLFLEQFLFCFRGREPAFIVLVFVCSLFGLYLTLLSIVNFLMSFIIFNCIITLIQIRVQIQILRKSLIIKIQNSRFKINS